MTRRPTQVFHLPRLAGVTLLSALISSVALPGLAQDTPAPAASPATPAAAPAAPIAPETVVATVGGQPITEADLSFMADDMGQNLASVPHDQVRAVLLSQMIELKLMAQAGRAAKLDEDNVLKLRVGYLTDRVLRSYYVSKQLAEAVTPDAIKAAYEAAVAAMPVEDEVHARHILVTTEEDAKAIKAELAAGANFDALAKEKSIEPGAKQSGGDLGYFTAGKMVKPFADAAFAMKVGDISEPVQTQFGWHIIKLEDRRPAAKPSLEDMTKQIGSQLSQTKYLALFDELRAGAVVDIPDAALKAQVDAQLAPLQQ